jgi:hypothetical protein
VIWRVLACRLPGKLPVSGGCRPGAAIMDHDFFLNAGFVIKLTSILLIFVA